MVGMKAIWGCETVNICSIMINEFIIIEDDKQKQHEVHVSQLEII